jgi:alcohol dehydrogenase (cytochrome c)
MRRAVPLVILLVAVALGVTLAAQARLDPALLRKPPVDAWPTHHGDYSGRHYSTLTQITQANVKNLTLAWTYRANTARQGAIEGGVVPEPLPFQLGAGALAGGLLKATPLYVNGVVYMSAPDHVWAIDARTGREIWHYYWRTQGGEHIGNRGLGMYGNWLYFGTPDAYLVSLDAATGKERWHKQIADVRSEYYATAAPVIVGNKLIVGLSGDALDVPGWIEAREPETGDILWKWYTTPRPGEPGAETWPDAYSMERGGGMTWQPVTYDPELNLIYVPTGNPNPVYVGDRRKGDNLYTASIVAVNADTGKMVWYFQASPHDTWDFDATQVPVLIDTTINGRPRKLVAQASRNGMFFLLDRVTGENILSKKFLESSNVHLGFDKRGQPIPNPAKDRQYGGALVSPSNGGAQNWAPPTYMPETGLLYMNVMKGYDVHYKYDVPEPAFGSAGHQAQAVGGVDMSLRALDVRTGEYKWIHKYAGSEWNPPRPHQVGGLLSTAGGLVFSGAVGGFMVAYHPTTGRQLWHATLPSLVSNTPITYMMDGRQYLVFAANDVIYAYVLPK